MDLGNVDAMFQLGYAYNHGNGVEKNQEKAIEIYQKAVNLGNASTMNN